MARIAVITPAYNAESYIAATVRSVLRQTEQDWEMVIVDDGSVDRTGEVAAACSNDRRIRIIWQENQGVAVARNTGIAASESEFVTFLDADDVLDPQFLSRAWQFLDADSRVGLVRGRLRRIRGNGSRWNRLADWRNHSTTCRTWDLFSDDMASLLLLGGSFPPLGVMLRRDAPVFEDWFNPSLRGTEDSELWTRLAVRGVQFSQQPFPGGYYRIHEQGASQNYERMLENLLRWMEVSHSMPELGGQSRDMQVLAEGMIRMSVVNRLSSAQAREEERRGLEQLQQGILLAERDLRIRHHVLCSLVRTPSALPFLESLQSLSSAALWEARLRSHLVGSGRQNYTKALCEMLHPIRTANGILQALGVATRG